MKKASTFGNDEAFKNAHKAPYRRVFLERKTKSYSKLVALVIA
jgi:hypothetical protein